MKYSFFSLCLATWVLSSCAHQTHEKQKEPELKVTTPIQMDTFINKEYVCQIQAINHIELRSQERGYLQKIFVDEGQYVKQGQAMFQIMPMIYQAEMEKSKANVEYATIEYENTKTLADKNIVSPAELALAKAKLDQEQADLRLANTHLGLTTIRAPFNGMMGRFHMRLGSLVDEGELLTSLSDNSKLWVYFNVPESEYLDYATRLKKEGPQKVKLLMANNEIYPHDGLFQTVEADFNNETGNIAFRATFPNPDRLLRHGETGTIFLPSHIKNALFIPQAATFDILDKKFVFVVDDNGQVNTRQITVGIEIPHLYSVTNGLSPHEKVLIDGLRKVKNGDKIKTTFKPFHEVLHALNNMEVE